MFTPQNMSGKARIPEALAAVMQAAQAKQKLQQAAQVGQFQPTTQTGQPTVAEQQLMGVDELMQQMAPPQPAVQQVAQQAGMGNQIQAMQQQQAQQQAQDPQAIAQMAAQMMAQRQAQQSQMDQGIAAAPGAQAVRMAEGGIVGYAGDDDSYVLDPSYTPTRTAEEMPTGKTLAEIKEAINRGARFSDTSVVYDPDTGRAIPNTAREEELERQREQRRLLAQAEARRAETPQVNVEAGDPRNMLRVLQTSPNIPEGERQAAINALVARYGEGILQPASAQTDAAVRQQSVLAQYPSVARTSQTLAVPPEIAQYYESARKLTREASTEPASAQEILARVRENEAAQRQLFKERGLDYDYLQKQEEAAARRGAERMAYADKLKADLEQRRAGVGAIPQSVIDFMLGAQGFKGQGLGQIMRTGAGAMSAGEAAARQEGLKIQEMKFAYEDAVTKERQSLNIARQATAMGDWGKAAEAINDAKKQKNLQNFALAKIDESQAKTTEDIYKAQLQAIRQPTQLESAMSEYRRLLEKDPRAAQEFAETYALFQGGGRKPTLEESRQKILELYADNWEKMPYIEKSKLKEQGIQTYEDYVKYRDRIAGVVPKGGSVAPGAAPAASAAPRAKFLGFEK